jgi:hypothetical protein
MKTIASFSSGTCDYCLKKAANSQHLLYNITVNER